MSAHLYERAELYDLIYTWKDYAAETTRLVAYLDELGVSAGSRVLEGCCGTGYFLVHLQKTFVSVGFDVAPEMVAFARKKAVDARVSDLRFFACDEPFDAFLCLFSSIGYIAPADLPLVAERVFEVLRPGGVALIEPWLAPEAFVDGHTFLQTAEQDGVVCARAATGTLEGSVSHIDFAWSIARPHETEVFEERHSLHLVSREDLAAPFEAAGFQVGWEDREIAMRRGLLVLRKPAQE